ncbi:response regulator transcription factor [Nocardioides sp. KIGAM211]|uniref:Response regulator transcription factor n=1 Tax=Nocardioides luti TaxID=2761101 RepID=A0A7X0V9A8_9ACTN|nr:response regulator transcription factor [Nocardioides luti]MBB6626055.1 response regulator transcription factor [Nocardioides luti]
MHDPAGHDPAGPAPTDPIRVAVLDESELLVSGLRSMLAARTDRVVVVPLGHREAIPDDVDVVLYDVVRRTSNGPSLRALAQTSAARVVVFSWHADCPGVAHALRAGAAGFLAKTATAAEVLDALEDVHAGRPIRHVARGPRCPLHHGAVGTPSGLSAREAEVLDLIARGRSNQEIADACFLSVNSVKTYVRTAYRKIGVERRTHAVAWALAHGLGAGGPAGGRAPTSQH